MAIEVEIVLNDGSISKGLIRAEELAKKSGKNIGVNLGDEIEKRLGKSTTSLIKKIGTLAAAYMGIRTAVGLFKQAVEDSAATDAAINQLNVAMAQTGIFTREASDRMVEFAGRMQETTKFSDDAVLSTSAFIQNLGRLSETELKRATQATLDLATSLQIDLNAAAMLVGKAAAGNVESFSRYGLQVKKTGDAAKDFATVLEMIESRMGGSSQAATKTFEGAMTQLRNVWSDFLKSLGTYVTRSKAITAAFNAVSDFLVNMTNSVKGLGNEDVFKPIITNLAVIAQAGIASAMQISIAFQALINDLIIMWKAFKVMTTLGLGDSTNQELSDALQRTQQLKQEFANIESSPAITFFDTLISKVQSTNGKLMELTDNVRNQVPAAAKEAEEKVLLSAQQMASAIAGMTGSFVKNMRKGQSIFESFGGALIGMIGNMAVQIGTTLIGIGMGMEAVKASILGLTGGPAIFAGIALVALGTLLQSLSSGNEGANSGLGSGTAGDGTGGGVTAQPGDATELPEEEEQRAATIAVNIQGNVLDRRQTGLEIAEVIQETFGSNALVFST